MRSFRILSLLGVYLFGGMIYQKANGASGKDIIPNYTFWAAVGSAIKVWVNPATSNCVSITSVLLKKSITYRFRYIAIKIKCFMCLVSNRKNS